LIQADAEVGETRPVAGRGGFRNGTKYNDSYYGRETKFGGYSSQVKPYSAFVSWHWLGAGVTEMRYTLQSGIANAAAGLTNYRLNMKFQDVGLAIGLQTQFLFRKGGRQGFKSVYRSHLVLGYGQSTEGSLEVDYLGLTFKTQQFSGKSGFFYYGWETLEFDSFSIEWTAGVRVSSTRFGKPTAVSGGTTQTINHELSGQVSQVLFGVGLSF